MSFHVISYGYAWLLYKSASPGHLLHPHVDAIAEGRLAPLVPVPVAAVVFGGAGCWHVDELRQGQATQGLSAAYGHLRDHLSSFTRNNCNSSSVFIDYNYYRTRYIKILC